MAACHSLLASELILGPDSSELTAPEEIPGPTPAIPACLGKLSKQAASDRSIFVIGMRGAGKTTSGGWLGEILGWEFIDLDTLLEERSALGVSDIVRQFGWEEFRRRELDVLRDVMESKRQRRILSCGGGIVETEEARRLLKSWAKGGGIVLLVCRDTDQMVDYLMIDKTRPVYSEHIREVFERRKPWLEECSNFCYFSPHSAKPVEGIPQDFREFIGEIRGNNTEAVHYYLSNSS